MEIEDELQRFRLPSPPPGMRRSVLAAMRPWTPWPLAGAAAVLLACWAANTASEARLRGALASGTVAASVRPAGLATERLVATLPPGIREESLISLRLALEVRRP